jgi:hypothetical protein
LEGNGRERKNIRKRSRMRCRRARERRQDRNIRRRMGNEDCIGEGGRE